MIKSGITKIYERSNITEKEMGERKSGGKKMIQIGASIQIRGRMMFESSKVQTRVNERSI